MMTFCLAALCALSLSSQQDDARVAIDPGPEHLDQRVADASAPRTIQVHDLRDLVAPHLPSEFPLDSAFGKHVTGEDQAQARVERLAVIERMIRDHVRPGFARGLDGLQSHGDAVLVVTGTREHHAWVARFLELQRVEPVPYLQLEVLQVRGTAEQFEALGFKGPTEVLSAPRADAAHAALTDRRHPLETRQRRIFCFTP